METYRIIEKQNLNSLRTPEIKKFKTLTAAKQYATRNQVWVGTVLEIQSENGTTLCCKGRDGWHNDVDYLNY
jgi:hypothetical protein